MERLEREPMSSRVLGALTIDRVVEREEPEWPITELIPEATPGNLAPHRHWLEPHAIEPATGKMILPVQTYVVRTRHHTVLIDTCVGDDKDNEWHPPWHRLGGDAYLANLAAAGVHPEAVDFVMCTHLHSDHVGWNTRRADGRWVPTFTNARYVFARDELGYWEGLHGSEYCASFEESVLPVIAAGQHLIVDSDHALDDEVRLEPLPGHTPGHVGIHLSSQGAEAIMCGDVMHSPVQCAHPEWAAVGDVDSALAATTRRAFLERYCETDTLVLTAHFPSPSVGHIVRHAEAFRFRYDSDE